MTNAIRILRKDARHLWPVIATFLATLALFAVKDPTYSQDRIAGQYLSMFLALACGLLVVMPVHEERLIGDEQYWLTRPFDRRELLLSKALFLLVFVHLPVFACQAIVLETHGFNVGEHIGDLFAKQVFLAAIVVLPLAAIASVTRNLGRAFLLVMLIAVPVILGLSPSYSQWSGLISWIRTSAVALVAGTVSLAILWMQYRTRRNVRSMCILAAGAALAMALGFARPWAAVLQGWLSDRAVASSAVQIRLDSRPGLPAPGRLGKGVFAIPMRFDGVPPGLEVYADGVAVRGTHRGTVLTLPEGAAMWLIVENFSEEESDRRVRVSGDLDLTLLDPRHRNKDCVAFSSVCITDGYGPYPTSPWFGPLVDTHSFVAGRPVAHIERHFDFGELRLADYQVPAK